jgi:hypothetical protein
MACACWAFGLELKLARSRLFIGDGDLAGDLGGGTHNQISKLAKLANWHRGWILLVHRFVFRDET